MSTISDERLAECKAEAGRNAHLPSSYVEVTDLRITFGEINEIITELQSRRSSPQCGSEVKKLLSLVHQPNPNDPSRWDVAPGKHREFCAFIAALSERSALEPAEDEPAAWQHQCWFADKGLSEWRPGRIDRRYGTDWRERPLFTRPASLEITDEVVERAAKAAVDAPIIPLEGGGAVTLSDYVESVSPQDAVDLGVLLTEKTSEGKPRYHPFSDIRYDEWRDVLLAIATPMVRAALTAALGGKE